MPANEQPPYISVVVAARNDNHGGNMLGRMQAFLDSWIGQARRYGLTSEIVVVEWNPPAERPRLKDALRWPEDMGACEVRFVEVSRELHGTVPNSVGIPLHQMIAKNVGVRRARGEYVLASNLDIIFSAELMRFIADRRLEPATMYRMDRYDVASEVPRTNDADELVRFCEENILRVFAREGMWDIHGGRTRPVEHQDILAPDSGIRLGDGWYGLEHYEHVRMRYPETEAEVFFDRPASAPPRMTFEVEVGPSAREGWLELEVLDPAGLRLASAIINGRAKLELTVPGEPRSGRFLMRTANGGVPLESEPRMLDMRIFHIGWAGSGGPEARLAGTAPEMQFDIAPGDAHSLDKLDVSVSDRQGHTVTFSAGPAELKGLSESADLRVSFQMGFRAKGEAPSAAGREHQPESKVLAVRSSTRSGWKLEVLERGPGQDWSKVTQRPHAHAASMRNPAYLHTNACGDFTVLSREDWWRLRAYPEFPIWPLHVDSIFCYSAHHAGVREVVLRDPLRVFHIQHFSGAGWTPEGDKELNARIAAKKVATFAYPFMVQCINHMRRWNAPIVFGGSNWGLADHELPETIVRT